MKKIVKPAIGAVALLLCMVGVLLYHSRTSAAEFDTSKAVTFEQFTAKNTVDDTTLFIGTYLIYMDSMTDELYNMATASASDANQFKTYYKSELAGGAWFDITDAEGIKDISDSAVPAPASEMNPLWITYVVGKDGTVRDAKSMMITNPYNDPDPYDLYNLPEMEPIRNQYDLLTQNEGATGVSDDYYREVLNDLLSYEYKSSRTSECDRKIDALFELYKAYLQADKKAEGDIVFELMGRVDALRRAEVMNWLIGADEEAFGFEGESALDDYSSRLTVEGFRAAKYPDWDNDDVPEPEFVMRNEVDQAMGDARSSCNTAYNKYVAKQLVDGETVLKHMEYTLSNQVIEQSSGGMSRQMDTILSKLHFVYNIEDGVIEDKDGELNLIETELLPSAQQNYIASIGQGESGEYKASADKGYARNVLNSILDDQKTKVDQKRTDLQMMIRYKTDRMDSEDALEFTNGRIELTNTWRGNIKKDAFKTNANETVDAHIEWLKELAQSIINADESLKSELDLLMEKKEELLALKQEALDDNDRNKAAKIDKLMGELDKQIAAKTAELEDKAQNGDAQAEETLRGAGTESGSNMNLKEQAKKAIRDGDKDAAKDAIGALAQNGATDELNELASELKEAAADAGEGGDELLSELEKTVEDAKETAAAVQKETGLGLSTEKPSGAKGLAGLSADDLSRILADVLGAAFDQLDAKGKVIAASGMNRVGKLGCGAAGDLAKTMIMQCRSEGNRYTYADFEADSARRYFSLNALGHASGYRYAYSSSKQEATLSLSGKVYRFKVNANSLTLADGTKKEMKYKTVFQKEPYVSEEDTASYFGCKAEYIEATKLAACLTDKMSEKADAIVKACKEAAGTEGAEE